MTTQTGQGQKLQPRYSGPFIVDNVYSDRRVLLNDAVTGICSSTKSVALPFGIGHYAQGDTTESLAIQTDFNQPKVISSQTEAVSTPPLPTLPPVRPKRVCDRPLRYRDMETDMNVDSGSALYYKVRRILGQKGFEPNVKYLTQFAGEPAQNSVWVAKCDLDMNTRKAIQRRPPPILAPA